MFTDLYKLSEGSELQKEQMQLLLLLLLLRDQKFALLPIY